MSTIGYIRILLFISCIKASGQCVLVFHPVFGEDSLTLEKYYPFNNQDSVRITALRFYISQIELLDKNKTVWKEKNSYHLLDASNEKSMRLILQNGNKIKYSRVKFNLGIDSVTNVSGALGGDLDPTKGMYWAWQSGYINIKLEGNSNLCKGRNNEFQLHLGGYMLPYSTMQTIFMKMPGDRLDIIIDIKQLLKDLDLSKLDHVMSPGAEAMRISEILIQSLNIKR